MMEFLKLYGDEETLVNALMQGSSLMKYSERANTGLKDKGDNKSTFKNELGYIGEAPVKKCQFYDALLKFLPVGTKQEDINIKEMHGMPRSAVFGGSVIGRAVVDGKKYDFELYFEDYEDDGRGITQAKRYTLDEKICKVSEVK